MQQIFLFVVKKILLEYIRPVKSDHDENKVNVVQATNTGSNGLPYKTKQTRRETYGSFRIPEKGLSEQAPHCLSSQKEPTSSNIEMFDRDSLAKLYPQ